MTISLAAVWTDDLADPSSTTFKQLASKYAYQVQQSMSSIDSFKLARVIRFTQASRKRRSESGGSSTINADVEV